MSIPQAWDNMLLKKLNIDTRSHGKGAAEKAQRLT